MRNVPHCGQPEAILAAAGVPVAVVMPGEGACSALRALRRVQAGQAQAAAAAASVGTEIGHEPARQLSRPRRSRPRSAGSERCP